MSMNMPTGNELLAQIEQTPIIPNSLAIWGLGQMGVIIKGPDGVLYIDPCLSDIVLEQTKDQHGDWWARAYPPPLQPEQVTNANYILSSHDHADHLDSLTLGPAAVASPNAMFVVTGWSLKMMDDLDIGADRIIVPPLLSAITLHGTSAKLTAIPAAHYERETDPEMGDRFLGYVIEWNGVTFYHSGDTIIFDGYLEIMRGLPAVDIAMLATNGRDYWREADTGAIGNLWPYEVVRLAKELGWKMVIPAHNDLYPNNTIPQEYFVRELAKLTPRQPFKYLQPGELYYFVK